MATKKSSDHAVTATSLYGSGNDNTFTRETGFVRDLGMDLEAVPVADSLAASIPPTINYSPIVWYRMLIPELLPDLDRVLVLDVDLIVLQSLWPLFSTDLGTNLLAAVGTGTALVGSRGRLNRFRNLGLDPSVPYLNTGVMLMDLRAMRAEKIGPRALALGHERSGDLVFPQQDALNVIAQERWGLLHPRWNAMSHLWLFPGWRDPTYPDLANDAARMSPAIVHFEGLSTVKPWSYRSVHPLRTLYRSFRATTRWPLEELDGKTLSGAVLRHLPLRWQYAVSQRKARIVHLFRR